MKLELKHLAPYLPYGLKFMHYKEINIYELDALYKDCALHFKETNRLDYCHSIINNKPILRPLSDLTKEIEHNGEKFVPIERLFEINYPANKSKEYYYDSQTNHIRCSHINTSYHKIIYIANELVNRNNYGDILLLLEWKLDIFGLIENGLAVAVTDEFNPYK